MVRTGQRKSDVRMATKGNAQRDCANGEQEQERGDTETGIFQGSRSRLSWPRASYETRRHSTAKPKFHGFMQIHAQLLTFTLADFLVGYFVPGVRGLETATRMEKHGAAGSRPINALFSLYSLCMPPLAALSLQRLFSKLNSTDWGDVRSTCVWELARGF